jgi:monoterpene epsilon-lactone hydrolase
VSAAVHDRELRLSSYLRWVPRATPSLLLGLVLFVLGKFFRLTAGPNFDPQALRIRLTRIDSRFMRIPGWLRQQWVQADGIQARWINHASVEGGPVLLYLHGGAFTFRLPNAHAIWAGRLSRELRARVLMPDYRLAPEHPYPAAIDDACTVYRWLLSQGIEPHRIVVGGESAGGNLTLALLLRLAHAGLPQPAAAFAISPVTDAALTGDTYRTRAAADPILDAATMPFFRDQYVSIANVADPFVSPIHGHYRGLPPILIQIGTNEILLDDACRAAQRIHESGGRVSCEVWEGMPHAFPLLDVLRESELALSNIGRFVLAVPEFHRQ